MRENKAVTEGCRQDVTIRTTSTQQEEIPIQEQ